MVELVFEMDELYSKYVSKEGVIDEANDEANDEVRQQQLDYIKNHTWDSWDKGDRRNKFVKDTPHKCGNCETKLWHVGAYTDGDDVVCGKCNGTAWHVPWEKYLAVLIKKQKLKK